MNRVVCRQPGPLAWSGHDVQVIEVITGHGHRWAVITMRDDHDVARADLGEDVDGTRRGPVDPLVSQSLLSGRALSTSK